MLKLALLDCMINEKCCSVGGGTGHLLFFFVPTPGDLTGQESPPPEFAIQGKKNANSLGSASQHS